MFFLLNIQSDFKFKFVSRYLNLLTDKALFPVLRDSENNYISLPPLSNSEKTRVRFLVNFSM